MKLKEIVPVHRSSDYPTFFLCECANFETLELSTNFCYNFLLNFLLCHSFKMEDLNECLLIAKIEVSCWKDQLKQVVSPFQFIKILHTIQSISI